jgi:hypothetical protein
MPGVSISVGVGINSSKAGLISGGTPVVPSEFGLFYDKTVGNNLADWSITNPTGGVSFTQSGNDLILSGTSGGNLFQDYMILTEAGNIHKVGQTEKWKFRYRITTGTIDGNSFGIGFGWRSQSINEKIDHVIRPIQDTFALAQNSIYMGDTVANGLGTQRNIAGSGFAVQSATTYEVEIWRDEFTTSITWYASNGTTVLSSASYSPPIGAAARFYENTGSPIIFQFGGTTTLHWLQASLQARKNVTSAVFGDSIPYGAWATLASDRYFEQVMSNGSGTFEICGGPADTSADLIARQEQIAAFNPQHLCIHILSNDIGFGISSVTYEANILALQTYLLANTTSKVYWLYPCARNDVNVTPAQTFLDGMTIGARETKIDLFAVTKNAGNSNLQAAFNFGDGVHLNNTGQGVIETEVFSVAPEIAG